VSIPTETQRLRLTKAREMLLAIDEDRLHMRSVVETAACGTAYCLAGWMAVDPWFRANTAMGELFDVVKGGLIVRHGEPAPAHRDFYYAPGNLLDIAQAVLGLTHRDATNLFAGNISSGCTPHAVTREEVINNLDRLLADDETVKYAAVRPER
jgi:hypothetical protein